MFAAVQTEESASAVQGFQSQCDPCFLGQVKSSHPDSYPESLGILPYHFLNYRSFPNANLSWLVVLQ